MDKANRSGEEVEAEQPAEEQPTPKKLRLSEPDLTIVLKYSDEDDTEIQKEYKMYSFVLANISGFVDTALSVNMKEKEEKTIEFPGVTPKVFDLSMKLATNPAAARTTTLADALEVLDFFHKYQFNGGLELCDYVVWECFEAEWRIDMEGPPATDLDLLVDAAVAAFNFNLPRSRMMTLDWLNERLGMEKARFGAFMFSVEHIRTLQPMFEKYLILNDTAHAMSSEEVSSVLFPKFFVSHHAHKFETKKPKGLTLRIDLGEEEHIFHLKPSRNGNYSGRVEWQGKNVRFKLERNKVTSTDNDGRLDTRIDDWKLTELRDNEERTLWQSPYSCKAIIPPKSPWVPTAHVTTQTQTMVISEFRYE